MSEATLEVPAFACCSVGIGRWFWVAWESESDARAFSPALATGYEKSAARAEEKAVEQVGPRLKHLPAKWASGYKRGGGGAARALSTGGEAEGVIATRPKARFGRPADRSRRAADRPISPFSTPRPNAIRPIHSGTSRWPSIGS